MRRLPSHDRRPAPAPAEAAARVADGTPSNRIPLRNRLPDASVLATLLALLALLASAVLAAAQERTAAQYSEEEIKAAMLAGFARTTEWPAGAFKDGSKNLIVGLLYRDTLGEKATRPFAEPTAPGSRPVQFKLVSDESGARGCHVLFVPRQERRRAREMMDRLKGAPILTVGETDDFLDLDGMVCLVPKEGKMKFEVNLNAAKAVNLKIPAKVLGVALKVRGKYDD